MARAWIVTLFALIASSTTVVMAQAASAAPTVAVPPGQVRVVGTVFDAARQPLAGVLVAALQAPAAFPTTGIRSGADGRYELTVAPGTYHVRGVRSGYTPQSIPVVDISLASTSGPDLTLARNDATLTGVVRDAGTGLSVTGALVLLGDANGYDVAEATSGADGAYTIHAVAGNYPNFVLMQVGGEYFFRTLAFPNFALGVGSASMDFALPTLNVTGSPCTTAVCQIAVSGAGYTPNDPVLVSLYSSGGATPMPNPSNSTTLPDAHGRLAAGWSFAAQPGTYEVTATRSRAGGSAVVASSVVYVVQTPTTPSNRIVTFDDLANPNRPLLGEYPSDTIDWGNGAWYLAGPDGPLRTKSVRFDRAGRTSASFKFVTRSRLVQLDVFNGGPHRATISVRCAGQPTLRVQLQPNELRTLVTNWTGTCRSVTLHSSNGPATRFDALVISTSGNALDYSGTLPELEPISNGVETPV